MASRPPAPRTALPSNPPSTTTTNNNVRRNLFHHQLSKRPTTTTSASTSTTSGTTLQDSIHHDDSSDIVVRDRNGNYDVQIPTLRPQEVDEGQGLEDEGVGGVVGEKEKLDAMLVERFKERSLRDGESAELLAAVQASLRRRVESLDENNWIFEAEQERHGG